MAEEFRWVLRLLVLSGEAGRGLLQNSRVKMEYDDFRVEFVR